MAFEAFIRFRFLYHVKAALSVQKKAIFLIGNKKVRDSRKEKLILAYAFRSIRHVFVVFFILASIALFFIAVSYNRQGFLPFLLSSIGDIESFFMILCIVKLRQWIIG